MNELATTIADNKLLQAAAIIFTLATAVIYLYKYLPAALKFGTSFVRNGLKKALLPIYYSVRPRVRVDQLGSRLMMLSIFGMIYKLVLRFSILGLTVIQFALAVLVLKIFKDEKMLSDNMRDGLNYTVLIAFVPIIISVMWSAFKPMLEFLVYLSIARRRVRKALVIKLLGAGSVD